MTKSAWYKTNYASFVARIDSATTVSDCTKLEKSLDRLYDVGAFTVSEFRKLDAKIVDRMVASGFEEARRCA